LPNYFQINHNGPAIKLENVAEQMEAGKEKIPLLENAPEAGMSEAWRAFCKSRYRVF